MSAVVCAPQCAATCSRPAEAATKDSTHAPPLVDAEEDPLAGRPQREQAVEPGVREELDVRRNGFLVETVACERRHGGGQGTSEHVPTLLTGRYGSSTLVSRS